MRNFQAISCWSELNEGLQEAFIRSLETALASPSIPKDIVTTLEEFMEPDEESLPLDSIESANVPVSSAA